MSFPVVDFIWMTEIRSNLKVKRIKVKGKKVVVRFDNGWRRFGIHRNTEDFLWDCVDLGIEIESAELKFGEVIVIFKFKRVTGESDHESQGIRLEDYA